MTTKLRWALAAAALIVLQVPLGAWAQAPDVTLYELTENMHVKGGVVKRRLATSALGGFAHANTILCPAVEGLCVVNAVGSDSINTRTGKGPIEGTFTVVINEANTIDIPEEVVSRGQFEGRIDLSPALVGSPPTPLGTMKGRMTVGRRSIKFVGVFRLPFACGPDTACYVTSGPDAVPTGVVPVDASEYALGYPMVRLDIWFE